MYARIVERIRCWYSFPAAHQKNVPNVNECLVV